MTRTELLAQAVEAGFTEAQFKAFTVPQRTAFLHAAAHAKSSSAHIAVAAAQAATVAAQVAAVADTARTHVVYRQRLIAGGSAPLVGVNP